MPFVIFIIFNYIQVSFSNCYHYDMWHYLMNFNCKHYLVLIWYHIKYLISNIINYDNNKYLIVNGIMIKVIKPFFAQNLIFANEYLGNYLLENEK